MRPHQFAVHKRVPSLIKCICIKKFTKHSLIKNKLTILYFNQLAIPLTNVSLLGSICSYVTNLFLIKLYKLSQITYHIAHLTGFNKYYYLRVNQLSKTNQGLTKSESWPIG